MSNHPVKPILPIPSLPPLGRRLLAEMFGTFFLVFVIGCVNDLGQSLNQGGIAVGMCLTMLVFSLGHISGAHFNPAVSFATFCCGFLNGTEFASYVVVQVFGGWLGSLVVWGFEGDTNFPVPQPVDDASGSVFKMFVAEFICTMALANAVCQATCSKQRGNHFFGLAIGFAVLTSAYSVGKYSGGSFNPAVSTALMVTHAMADSAAPLKWWPVYVIAELLGGFCAFLLFCLMGSYADGEGNNNATQKNYSEADAAEAQECEKQTLISS